ncbi:hypothetical protein SDC9_122563 [bioreactor metagenome]|uniref:Inner membrane protein YgaP-like transmembrane domain-containing protein n=1 Tax=bioreactor metagenome TaxID=1076179 RepID=A0A645CF18_9ZZZZ|nr:DUF2892 domain-containing protein [Candidatus Metalachnospira sp.]
MNNKIKIVLPATTERVAKNTCSKVNDEIRNRTIQRLNFYRNCCNKTLTQRINELNHEWDTERVIETNAASIIFLSSMIGYKKTKCCCFFMTGTIGFFLLQHALQGWCPSLPVIRKLGIRTEAEIHNEISALKCIRGDFMHNTKDADEMLAAAEKK